MTKRIHSNPSCTIKKLSPFRIIQFTALPTGKHHRSSCIRSNNKLLCFLYHFIASIRLQFQWIRCFHVHV
uniref:Uncharacterized protein n=1 Tax=Gossypium raimondii TaxID=29730 RepID=A0A0D2VM28_GOSRA|nr:hypothetical protein B456_N027800 [Gossypium raimondii]